MLQEKRKSKKGLMMKIARAPGFEPEITVLETVVIAISLRPRFMNMGYERQKQFGTNLFLIYKS